MMGNGLAAYTQGESRVHIHNISLDIVMGFVVERDVNRLNQLTSVSTIFALLKSFFSSQATLNSSFRVFQCSNTMIRIQRAFMYGVESTEYGVQSMDTLYCIRTPKR